jgi:hypothetical protein
LNEIDLQLEICILNVFKPHTIRHMLHVHLLEGKIYAIEIKKIKMIN